jgi:hypothetical protein
MINRIKKFHIRVRKGMALLEVLLGIAVLAVLFTLIMSKIDIGDVFAKLWATSDEVGVRAIGSAMTDYRWDNGADVPTDANLSSTLKPICKQTVSTLDCASNGGAHLNSLVPVYIQEIPVNRDYTSQAELMTGYQIQYPVSGGRVRITNDDETEEFVH